jgi:bifunctional non-homologous end joining protein LigD
VASVSSFPYPAGVAKSLDTYNAKRDFSKTPEPPARAGAKAAGNSYVIQKHAARRLHYDFRLELDGVMKSWAVPEGPSLIAGKKRLAVHVEDHPLEYAGFEGVIPPGQYGSGTVMIWDQGTWTPDFDPAFGYRKGHLKFQLDGQKLKGQWHLVRMAPKPREKQEAWLLFKADDAAARPADATDILVVKPNSAATGRTMDAIAREQDRVWASGQGEVTQPAKKKRRHKVAVDPAALAKAKAGALPGFIEPSLPSPTERAPTGRGWLHEIKHDGYRLQAHLENGRVRLFSRQGLDWTERFPALAHALAGLPVKVAIIDGEAVVHTEAGVASFTALVDALKTGRGDMEFYAFDLLYLDGFDLRASPLGERKAALAQIIAAAGGTARLRYSDHIEGDGDTIFRHASRLGLEGIISKMASSPYQSGRVKTWLKLKSSQNDGFVIAGFIPSSVDKAAVSALVLGEYAGEKLVPVGHVGSGFTVASARELRQRLEPLRTGTPPLEDETAEAKGVRWVEPVLSADIEYRTRTGGGLIRHAVFRELVEGRTSPSQARETVPSERNARSRAARDAPLPSRLTNPGRLLWPEQGVTKQGLAEFYAEIADWILPHIAGRPLSLLRCPEGIAAQCFFQKHAWAGLGDAVRRVAVPNDEQPMLVIDDLAGLLELVQASVLEIHPWGAQADRPELPDRVTIDLDPDDSVPWQRVIDAAHEVRRRLQASGLESFVKTTGGKGLHVVFPLTPQADWDSVKAFAQSIAATMAADQPTLYTDNMAKSGRRGRIYVDYLRNGMGATAVGAYSTRARDGAPVSVPLDWDELGPDIRANHFAILNLPNRLAFLDRDPWRDLATLKQTLPAAVARPSRRNETVPSKAELGAYWKKVGKEALVHLARRPLDLVPHDPSAEMPRAVKRIAVGDGHRSWVDSIDGLLGLVAMGAVELLPWNATIDDLDHPDLLVFALADRSNNWQRTVATALRLRGFLQAEGLESWPKLSGGPELHVMVPIEPELDWQEAQRYGKDIAGRLAGAAVDCRYNARGAAAIGAFSPRALPGFPIAAPLDWDRLQRGVEPAGITLRQPRTASKPP